MEITVFIVFCIITFFVYLSLNSKIENLERKVNSLGKVSPTVNTTVSAVVPKSIPESVPLNNNIVKLEVSGEEKGGKFLGKIGVVAILLAGAFFLKDVPNEGKVIIGLLVGILFIGLGFYLRTKYKTYAHVLMGSGIALLYLTVFAATSVFHMIDSTMGFALMIFVTIISIIISIIEDAIELATLGALGGFLTPILISTGSNNYVGLFSYLLILDLGILAVTFKKKWLGLYHVGFWGTGLLFFVWCAKYFDSSLLSPAMIFLTLYFLVFLFASIFHHLIRKEKSDSADIFGIAVNAILYFSTSISLLYTQYSDNLGYFAFALAVVYAIIAYVSYNTMKEDKLLNYLLVGISVVFLSITIPLQFSGSWITVAWLIEALVLYFIAFYIPHEVLKRFGLMVFALGVFRVLFYEGIFWSIDNNGLIRNAFLNFGFVLLILSVIIAYIIQYLYSKFGNIDGANIKSTIAGFMLVANILTVAGITSQIYLYYENDIKALNFEYTQKSNEFNSYRGSGAYSEDMQKQLDVASSIKYEKINSLNNQRNTIISVFWAIYAVLLIAIGFIKKTKFLRTLGLVFFVITAIKIFVCLLYTSPSPRD